MIVADKTTTLTLTGNGDVLEPTGAPCIYSLFATKISADGVVAVGSGGDYALAAARGIVAIPQAAGMDPEDIARKAMEIAADVSVITSLL